MTKRNENTGAFKRVMLALVVLLLAATLMVGAVSAEGPVYVASIGDKGYEELTYAFTNATNGDTIVMQQDVVLETYLDVTESVTLDLNGKTISSGTNMRQVIQIHNGAEFTITDNSEKQDGEILQTHNSGLSIGVIVFDATMNLRNGKIRNAYTGNGYGIYLAQNSASVIIESGMVQGSYAGIYCTSGSTLAINGGTVTGTK